MESAAWWRQGRSATGLARALPCPNHCPCSSSAALLAQAFSAFTNDVIWLIVVSFFFARVRSSRHCVPSGSDRAVEEGWARGWRFKPRAG